MKRLLTCLLIVFLCAVTAAPSVYAAQTSEELLEQQKKLHEEAQRLEKEKKNAEKEKDAAQSGLSAANDSIRQITGEREMVGEAISDLNDDLVSLLATITMIEEEITETEVQISDTLAAYNEAKHQEEEQYAAMKSRARFMYERGDQDMVVLLLQSESISEFLNRATYVRELYDYDRRELDAFIQTKNEAEALGEQLEEEKSELEADHFELEQSQADMEAILEELKKEAENYDVMLVHAKQDAAAYQLKIKQQASTINQLASQIQQKTAEEEKVKKEAQAVKKREEAEKAKAEKAAREEASGDEDSAEDSGDSSQSGGSSSDGEKEKQYSAPGSATGANIAAYACQFVGNPYVPGGTSLTNGCDCSGFTMSVYKAFGISIPRTSWSQQRAGKEVSFENARAGDIICYAGHVAIYLGDGRIVHASTQKTGIKYGNANYKTIITIRRLV